MKWEQETWRKLYVRVDAKWLSLPVSARGLGSELLKYADDNGDLHLGNDPPGVAVAFLLSARPKEHRRIAEDLDLLMSPDHRFLEPIGGGSYRIRNFVLAQAKSGSAKRMALKRARDAASDGVTVTSHVTSLSRHSVTSQSDTRDANKVTDPIRSDPIRSPQPPKGGGDGEDQIPEGAVEAVWLAALRRVQAPSPEAPRPAAVNEMAQRWADANEDGLSWPNYVALVTRLVGEWVSDVRASGKQQYTRRWPWAAFTAWEDQRYPVGGLVTDDDPTDEEIAAGGSIQ